MFFAVSVCCSTSIAPKNIEMDIDNCFWNLDKEGVLCALGDVAGRVKKRRKIWREVWFRTAKGGDKTLYQIGKASAKKARTISLTQVLQFGRWDVFHSV